MTSFTHRALFNCYCLGKIKLARINTRMRIYSSSIIHHNQPATQPHTKRPLPAHNQHPHLGVTQTPQPHDAPRQNIAKIAVHIPIIFTPYCKLYANLHKMKIRQPIQQYPHIWVDTLSTWVWINRVDNLPPCYGNDCRATVTTVVLR